jgi:CubicO group peptidase (beta-lactamase class C family)
MKKNVVIIFISIISIQVGLSQTIDTLKLNNYFKSLDSNNKFMGSVALMKNGKIIYKNQIGYSDIERQKKQNENTKYRIGSISKTFTSVLVFKAIEEGKLDLEKTINNYFPDIRRCLKIKIV